MPPGQFASPVKKYHGMELDVHAVQEQVYLPRKNLVSKAASFRLNMGGFDLRRQRRRIGCASANLLDGPCRES
jgi:hypothetical protein